MCSEMFMYNRVCMNLSAYVCCVRLLSRDWWSEETRLQILCDYVAWTGHVSTIKPQSQPPFKANTADPENAQSPPGANLTHINLHDLTTLSPSAQLTHTGEHTPGLTHSQTLPVSVWWQVLSRPEHPSSCEWSNVTSLPRLRPSRSRPIWVSPGADW